MYFPLTATVTLSYLTENGDAADISIVGNEGVIGIPLFLNGKVAPCRALVRKTGTAYCMSAQHLTWEFNRPGPALRKFLGYARALTAQMEQTVHCDAHNVDLGVCARCDHAAMCPRADQR